MKKINYSVIALMLGIVLCVTGCKHDTSEPPYADYFGVWKNTGGQPQTVTLTANELIFQSNQSTFSYTMRNLTWTPLTNSNASFYTIYPTGYKITGKLTAVSGSGPKKASDESTPAVINDIAVDWWYISTDKSKLCWGSWTDTHGGLKGDFNKQ